MSSRFARRLNRISSGGTFSITTRPCSRVILRVTSISSIWGGGGGGAANRSSGRCPNGDTAGPAGNAPGGSDGNPGGNSGRGPGGGTGGNPGDPGGNSSGNPGIPGDGPAPPNGGAIPGGG